MELGNAGPPRGPEGEWRAAPRKFLNEGAVSAQGPSSIVWEKRLWSPPTLSSGGGRQRALARARCRRASRPGRQLLNDCVVAEVG